MTDSGTPRVTFLGHATVVIEMDGVRLLTDPILRERTGPLVRAHRPIPAVLWADVDVVLISHSHWDHLDYGSLRLVGGERHVVVPRGMRGDLRRRGFSNVSEVEPGDAVEIDGLRIETVHAEHQGFGPPVSGTSLAVGYVLHGSQRHYFAGDTAYFAAMQELRDIDLALLPVWGWGPTARASEHLDPLGAARAAAAIGPRIAVPIHWGTLHPAGFRWMRPSTRIDPPHRFAQHVRRLAPQTTVRVLPVGASLRIPPPAARPASTTARMGEAEPTEGPGAAS